MLPILIVLALGATAVALLSLFWQEIVDFSKKVIEKLQKKLKIGLEGFLVFLKKISKNRYEKKQKNFILKETGGYKEVTVTEEIDESAVEEKYKKHFESKMDDEFNTEIDITKDFQEILENCH